MINRKSTLKSYFTVEGETEGGILSGCRIRLMKARMLRIRFHSTGRWEIIEKILMDCELI